MKQVLQNLRTGKTSTEEVPVPQPKAGTALIRTAASLVSAGTERMVVEFAGKSLVGKARSRPDLVRQMLDKARREGLLTAIDSAFNRLDQPMSLGYSSAGIIRELGEEMAGFRIGQRVACAGGGDAVHAEYACVPRSLLVPIPDGVDFESAAFATLGAIAMHGFRLAEPQVGESVAVIGLGLLGLLAGQIAASAGCRVFGMDIDPRRVDLANRLEMQAVVNRNAVEAGRSFTAGRGFDHVLICADTSSSEPVELAGAIARDRAHVVATGAVGLELPRKIYYEKELSFINSRSYGPGRYDAEYEENGRDYPIGYVRWTENRNLEAVLGLMAGGRLNVKPLITHRFPIEKAPAAYTLITGKNKEPFLGVLLTYPQAPDSTSSEMVTFPKVHHRSSAIHLGVLGAGNFALAVLLPAIKKQRDIDLIGIASIGGLHAQHAGRKYGFAYAASDEDRVLSDPEINTLAILTRHDTHASLAARALEGGKHVFVEKPLSIDQEGLEKVVSALKTARGFLTVGFNRRFAPLAVQLHKFLGDRNEPLAMHYRVNAGYIPLNHWTQDPAVGGGRLIGEGCHFMDFLTYLVGAAPTEVTAQALPDAGRYHEDVASMTFRFPDGSIGVVDYLANGDKSFPKERIEVFCGGRVAVLDDFRTLELVQAGRRRVIRSILRQDKGHFGEWQAFIRAIREGGDPPIPYEQILGVTKASLAAAASLRTGTRVEIR